MEQLVGGRRADGGGDAPPLGWNHWVGQILPETSSSPPSCRDLRAMTGPINQSISSPFISPEAWQQHLSSHTNSSQQANDRYLDSKTQTLHCGTVQARRRDCRAWVSRREGAGCRARDLGLGRRTLLLGVLVVVRCSSSWRGRAAGGGGGGKETEKEEGGGSRAARPRNGSCRVPFGAGGLG